MKDLMARALEVAQGLGAEYADCRFVETRDERLQVSGGVPQDPSSGEQRGYGVRVLAKGAWGFASTPGEDIAGVERTVRRAVAGALAAAGSARAPVRLAPTPPARGHYRTDYLRDPFEVPIAAKLALLEEASRRMARPPEVKRAVAMLEFKREVRHFASSEGADVVQEFTDSGATMAAFAVRDGEVQRRSFPNSEIGDTAHRGYEFIEEMDLAGSGERIGEEAVELLSAPVCPPGRRDLIVGPRQLALLIHESCGHAVEADRAMGWETSFTGTSFLPVDGPGTFRYGSPAVHIVADPTVPGGHGSFWFDDEGVGARKVDMVREGILRGFLTSRETAALLGTESAGAMRADGWSYPPLIFMTNINLEPGELPIEEIVQGVDDGLLVDMNRSWSIDDKRLNFRFGTEVGYEIKGGRLGRLLKNASFSGITPEFWGSCDAVADREHWHLHGMPCGKGEPKQWGFIGHGCSYARFRGVRIGGAEA